MWEALKDWPPRTADVCGLELVVPDQGLRVHGPRVHGLGVHGLGVHGLGARGQEAYGLEIYYFYLIHL